MANGRLRSTARVLAQPYPEAAAGAPISMFFSPSSGRFVLTYRAARRSRD